VLPCAEQHYWKRRGRQRWWQPAIGPSDVDGVADTGHQRSGFTDYDAGRGFDISLPENATDLANEPGFLCGSEWHTTEPAYVADVTMRITTARTGTIRFFSWDAFQHAQRNQAAPSLAGNDWSSCTEPGGNWQNRMMLP